MVIFPGLLVDSVIIIRAPKFYILSHVENIQVDFDHVKAGTMGTSAYKIESQRAIGRAKEKLIEWQEAN